MMWQKERLRCLSLTVAEVNFIRTITVKSAFTNMLNQSVKTLPRDALLETMIQQRPAYARTKFPIAVDCKAIIFDGCKREVTSNLQIFRVPQ